MKTHRYAEQLQYFETMLQNLDPLIIYGGSKRTKVRKLARRTIQALDKHTLQAPAI